MALLNILFIAVLALVAYFLVSIAYKFRQHANYFKKNGIPYLGAGLYRTFQYFTGQMTIIRMEMEIYEEAKATKAAIVGLSDLVGASNLYIMDLDLAKNVYVKDFDHFVNRRPTGPQQTSKYFGKMLFFMEDEPWKELRINLSPSFTTSKIRRMFEIFQKSSERMETYMKSQMEVNATSVELDVAQIFSKYAMDVIATSAFGVDGKCWEVPPDQRSIFEQIGTQLQFNLKMMMKFIFSLVFPKLAEFLGIDVMDYESSVYFSGVIKDVMKKRRQTGEKRDDFLQLMMDAHEGLLKSDEETSQVMNGFVDSRLSMTDDTALGKISFEDDDIVANGMLFLLGGFDTTQSVLIFAIYSLALEPEVQQKLYEEVTMVMGKHGEKLTYKAVLEMSYLELVITETMRLYPPSVKAERVCTRDYAVPETTTLIRKGTIISIPIHPFHLDPSIFPDPEKFIPKRFTLEGKAARHSMAFMPFGHGPRNCIGMRFAMTNVKAAIAQLVRSFHYTPCSRTQIPIEYENTDGIRPKGSKMWINVTQRC